MNGAPGVEGTWTARELAPAAAARLYPGPAAAIRPRRPAGGASRKRRIGAEREVARARAGLAIIEAMSDDEPDRNSFEDVARALAEEVNRAVERLSEIDVDEIGRRANAEAQRARRWIDDLGRMLRDRPTTGREAPFAARPPWEPAAGPADRPSQTPPPADDPLRSAGPHPLDLPTADQGLALAALDSGRWRLEPGTSAVAVQGEGPGPSDALGLVRELRVRDWLSADGELTLTGRHALRRWLDAADRT